MKARGYPREDRPLEALGEAPRLLNLLRLHAKHWCVVAREGDAAQWRDRLRDALERDQDGRVRVRTREGRVEAMFVPSPTRVKGRQS